MRSFPWCVCVTSALAASACHPATSTVHSDTSAPASAEVGPFASPGSVRATIPPRTERPLDGPEPLPTAIGPFKIAAPQPPAVFRMGRFDDTDPRGPIFAWSGSTLRARFRGPSVHVRLQDRKGHNFFRVTVDSRTHRIETAAGEARYPVARNLDDTVHTVELVKRSEARSGEVQFLGFDFGGGSLVEAIPPRRRHIEIVGDSISTGWGLEANKAWCGSTRFTDETRTAGALAAEELDAEHTTIAWSGVDVRGMGTLWERTLPDRAHSRWSFSTIPDAVIINLGTNDLVAGMTGDAVFTKRYADLVGRIRARYERALLVLAIGPLLYDSPYGARFHSRALTGLTTVVEDAKQRGDERVVLLDLGTADPADGFGCVGHPSVATQRKMAQAFVRVLRGHLDW